MAEEAGENKGHTVTKAELVEEVTKVTELPGKNPRQPSKPFLTASSPRCRVMTKSRFAASEAFVHASAAGATDAIRRQARKWKFPRRKSPFSNPARN